MWDPEDSLIEFWDVKLLTFFSLVSLLYNAVNICTNQPRIIISLRSNELKNIWKTDVID